MVKQPSEGFFKKDAMRNFARFTKKHLCQCQFCRIYENTFLQNNTGRLILIIAVSIVAKGVLSNENVNYDKQTKAYVLI